MQRTVGFQLARVTVAGLAFCGFASAGQTSGQDQTQAHCSVESKNQYYRDFEASHEGDKRNYDEALKAAENYLACPDDGDHPELLAKLNLAAGRILSSKNLSSDAIPYFIKATSYNSPVKSSAETYAELARAYEEGPYAKLSDEYRERFEGKDETQESLLALENICLVIDRMIDAYARAVALAGVELPKRAQGNGLRVCTDRDPAEWVDTLIGFYKIRHNNSEAGLKELIGTILAQPLPGWPIPPTSPPR